MEPAVDPQLPEEQAGFRRGCSTVNQIVKLTDDIEDGFEKYHNPVRNPGGSNSSIQHCTAPGPHH